MTVVATNYFQENTEEREMMMKLLSQGIKDKNGKKGNQNDWYMFGLTPEEFEESTMNPATLLKQKCHDDESIHDPKKPLFCSLGKQENGEVSYSISENN
jgi:hypothetical protein